MSTAGTVTAREAGVFNAKSRRTIVAGWLSMLLQTYDIYLPVIVLPAAITYFIPKSLSAVTQVTLVNVIFAISVLAQPIGGLVVAPIADRLGRRTLVLLTNIGYVVVALAIAVLPGYAAWGYASIVLLLFLRLANGIFAASSPAGAIPFALERTPKPYRGVVGALLGVGPASGIVLLSAVQYLTISAVSPAGFVQSGWRIPFFFGAFIGLLETVLAWVTPEIEYFTEEAPKHSEQVKKASVREVFARDNLKIFGQTLLLYSGFLVAANIIPGYTPTLLINYLHQPPNGVSGMMLIASAITIVLAIPCGAASQKIGRRMGLILNGVIILFVVTPLYFLMVHGALSHWPFSTIAVLGSAIDILAMAPFSGMVFTYLTERYPFHIRASGFGAVYSLSTVLPGFYSFYLLALSHLMPYQYTVLVMVAIAGLLTWWGAAKGPETRDFDMSPTV